MRKIYYIYFFLLILILILIKFFFRKKKKNFFSSKAISIDAQKIKKILINNDVSINFINNFLYKIDNKDVNLENLRNNFKDEIELNIKKNIKNLFETIKTETTPLVFFIIGNNGVGKTSFVVKLYDYLIRNQIDKNKIMITSLDFFRAGAFSQLEELCNKNSIFFFNKKENNVKGHIFTSIKYAKDNNYSYCIFDTSGIMHGKYNLMEENKVLIDIVKKEKMNIFSIMVMDKNFGSISLNSFECYNNIFNINGIVLSKSDTFLGGGWLVKLVELYPNINLFGQITGEKINDFNDFNLDLFNKNLINWNEEIKKE